MTAAGTPYRPMINAGGRFSPVIATTLAALVSVLGTACGDGSAAGDDGRQVPDLTATTRPVALPPGVVATVGGGEVTRRELDRVVRARARGLPAGVRGSESQRRLRHTALVRSSMSQLIQAEDVAQRAKGAGVSVSRRQVDAALDRSRKAFDSPAQWRQFLERTNQTEPDVRGQLRVELLNRRLHARRPGGGSQSAAEAVRVSHERLRARTVCRPGYVVALCSNSPSKPTEAS